MQTARDRVAPEHLASQCPPAVSAAIVADKLRPLVAPEHDTIGQLAIGHLASGHLAIGMSLFSPGKKRHLYRVESGAVCHYARWPDGRLEVFEFAFPGDLIGFGYLSTHISSAVAMVETVVSGVSDAALSQAMAHDNMLAFSFADAGEREFEFLRMISLVTALRPPVQALASYLLAITSLNATEGRGGLLARDEVSSEYVACQLQMPLDVLSMALLSMCRCGIVEMSGNSWRIADAVRLEALAQPA